MIKNYIVRKLINKYTKHSLPKKELHDCSAIPCYPEVSSERLQILSEVTQLAK